MEQKWNFPQRPGNKPGESGEKSGFDDFKTKPHRHLVRELIQNSMDAPSEIRNVGKPICISVDQIDIPVAELPTLIRDLQPRMEACSMACRQNMNGRDPYRLKFEYLQENDLFLPCVRISDFNTTGMDYSPTQGVQTPFQAGVRTMGASHKANRRAGGSYGKGKTVGFVASRINAVYYSTMTEQGNQYGEGVIRLCDHIIDGVEYYGDAFFDGHDGMRPDTGLEIPNIFRRSEPGTDVVVLGYTLQEKETLEMKQEILRSFWRAILDNELMVDFSGEVFDANTLPELMEKYFPGENNEFDVKKSNALIRVYNPKPYFKHCVEGCDDGTHYLFHASSDQYPVLGSAKLFIYKNPSIVTEDRIVCMRDKKMAIVVKKTNTRNGFYGVFICDGDGSEILRLMENVTHDKWDSGMAKELGSEVYQKALTIEQEIDSFIKNAINTIFPETEDQEYGIPSLNNYLIGGGNINANKTASNTGEIGNEEVTQAITTTSSGIKQHRITAQKIGKLVVRRKGGVKKKKKHNTPSEDTYIPITQPESNPDTTSVGPTSTTTTGGTSSSGSTNDPISPITGEMGKLSAKGKLTKKKSGRHAEEIEAMFRVVPIMDDFGLIHRIIINSDANYSSCSLKIMISGEEKDSTLEFYPVDSRYTLTGSQKNILSGFNLVKGKNEVDIKFKDQDYHSLTISAYEN
jgi:hypothetical protein